MIRAGMVASCWLLPPDTRTPNPEPFTRYPTMSQFQIAAELLGNGFRIIPLASVVVGQTDYLFYAPDFVISTTDSDFHCKMERLPRIVASLIESYLRAVSEPQI